MPVLKAVSWLRSPEGEEEKEVATDLNNYVFRCKIIDDKVDDR